jgi:hypothetical protein
VPALDSCHRQIVRALQKDGWKINLQPHVIRVIGRKKPLYADIRAGRNNVEIIIAEVKCFETDDVVDVYTAIGQYLVYRNALTKLGTEYPLYLAIPLTAYNGIFSQFAAEIVSEVNIKLVVVDTLKEEIVKWIH